MKISRTVLMLMFLFAACYTHASILTLADNAKTNYTIIYTAEEKEAAEELKEHLDKITGADFKIINEKEASAVKGPAFYIGKTKFAVSRGIDFKGFANQEWYIKTIGNDIVIGGGKTRGSLYGVYDLLENKFGCRWYAYDTTVIPKQKILTLSDLEIRNKPAFDSREFFDDYHTAYMLKPEFLKAKQLFRKRIRSSLDYGVFGIWKRASSQYYDVHNFYEFVNPKKYFKEHPEYFSMDVKGNRFHGTIGACMNGGNLCLTNPDVINITYESLVDFIKKDRATLSEKEWPDIYDISPMDCSPFLCLCPNCKAVSDREGSDSGLLIYYLNEVGKRIANDYPGIKIRSCAYVSTNNAPKLIRPEKNIIMKWCNLYGFSDCYRPLTSKFNIDQKTQLDEWVKTGVPIIARVYWNMGGDFFNPARVETIVDAIAPDIRYYKKCGAISYFAEFQIYEGDNMQNFAPLQIYLGYKLLLDPDQDEEAQIKDFMTGYFGPAEKPMTGFLTILRNAVKEEKNRMRACNENGRPYCTEKFMKQVWEYLENAYNSTKPDTIYRDHVEREMLCPLYVILKNTDWTFGDRVKMIELYKQIRLSRLENYNSGVQGVNNKAIWQKRYETDLNSFVKINLPVPKGFENKKVIMIGWPKLMWAHDNGANTLVDDSDSVTGKAMVTPKKHYEKDFTKMHDMSKTGDSGYSPIDFGAFDSGNKKAMAWQFNERIPKDEKYHWYKIGTYDIYSGSFVWGFFWFTRCDLSGYWIPNDGMPDLNIWDIYVSVKITGPAYVNGSTKSNEIYWDQVMLVKPDNIDKKK